MKLALRANSATINTTIDKIEHRYPGEPTHVSQLGSIQASYRHCLLPAARRDHRRRSCTDLEIAVSNPHFQASKSPDREHPKFLAAERTGQRELSVHPQLG